jgi:glycosyltransferase involved in cell wall biosynthesis
MPNSKSQTRLKILLLITGLSRGGAEKQVLILAEEFLNMGHDVKIVSLTDNCDWPQYSHLSENIIPLKMMKNALSVLFSIILFKKIIRQFDPDIIHSHMFHANIIARLTNIKSRKRRLICSAHSSNEGGDIRMLIYRLTDSLCDFTTNVSKNAVNEFIARRAAPAGRIKVVHNGIRIADFYFNPMARIQLRNDLGIEPHTHVFVCIARLEPVKDLTTAIKAFVLYLKDSPDSCLLIVGDGSERNNLEKQVVSLSLKEKVMFLGFRTDTSAILSASDCLLLTSLWEGLPTVIIEGMSSGINIISTACGGSVDILPKHQNLPPPGDFIGIAKEMSLSRVRNPEDRIDAQRHANPFSIDSVAQNWIRLYTNRNA